MEPLNRADKKQKTDDSRSLHIEALAVMDLPDATLTRAATFLAFFDRVRFAMALPTWKHEEIHDVSKAIVGAEHVQCINFEESRQTDLASNLTDADLSHILTCVDAVNNLKSLYLTDCFKIEGHGLEPLRSSSKLVDIDLSLVGRYESPEITGYIISLSMDKVVSVLDSIIRSDQCALEHVQLPKSWRENFPSDAPYFLLRVRYESLPKRCNRCFEVIRTQPLCYDVRDATGLTSFKCFDCNVYYCQTCNHALRRFLPADHGRNHQDWATNEEGNEIAPILLCKVCEKGTCQICQLVKKCGDCHDNAMCRGCMERTHGCEDCWVCLDCCFRCDKCSDAACEMDILICECCDIKICSGCARTSKCEGCDKFKCEDCFGAQRCRDCMSRTCLTCAIDDGHLELDCLRCLGVFQKYHKRSFEEISEKMNELKQLQNE